ncbi:MAG: DNA mismatch repair protein MutS [Myxococcota bacterium]
MRQFFAAKEQYPDAIVFFRLGDFYEMFFDDAVVAAELLDITLTSRSKTAEGEKIPMAGVPHHAAAGYIRMLLEKGRSVAICEQMADPSTVKGVVPREVVRVVTPGLCLEPDALSAKSHNFLATVTGEDGRFGFCTLELSTAELLACELEGDAALLAELTRVDPREVRVEDRASLAAFEALLGHVVVGEAPKLGEDEQAELLAEVVGAEEATPLARRAAALALRYARETQPLHPVTIPRLGLYDPKARLVLDETAARNLELVRTLDGERRGSLLHLLDRTRTPMGARLLRRRLLAPLNDLPAIRRRLDRVDALVRDPRTQAGLQELLSKVGDIERLTTRAASGLATPRDLGSLRDSLVPLASLHSILSPEKPRGVSDPLSQAVIEDICDDLARELDRSLSESPPVAPSAGGVFREGYDKSLDEFRRLAAEGKDVILELEARERKATGIGSLKVKYTRVFGYYIEVTKSNLDAVPSHYRRKQTIANGERYITDELDELQTQILKADERAKELEQARFLALRSRVAEEALRLRTLGGRIAELDVDAALSEVARHYDYTRPEVDDSLSLEFSDLRHPIVEQLAAQGSFVPNDLFLDAEGERLMVVTGPNMAGKSTAMRQAALGIILAQMGSFVPARNARIGLTDRIFTRVGASDNLGQGQSTFMVEMRETASILHGATRRSFVILDEIGRGTSTYDGLAIAWAVLEHLEDAVGCRGMFATHYHELCELAETRRGIVNFNVAAKEYDGEVVFLHKLIPGSANRSYGVAVARLAGVPEIVLGRARSILSDLERGAPLPSGAPASIRGRDEPQLDLFVTAAELEEVKRQKSQVEDTLRAMELDHLKPVDALLALSRLQGLLNDQENE